MKNIVITDRFFMKLLSGIMTITLFLFFMYDQNSKYLLLLKDIDLKSISFIQGTLFSIILGTIVIVIGYVTHSVSIVLIENMLLQFIRDKSILNKLFFIEKYISECKKDKELLRGCLKDIKWKDYTEVCSSHQSILNFATAISYYHDNTIHANRGSIRYAIFEFLTDLILLCIFLILYLTYFLKLKLLLSSIITVYFLITISMIYYHLSYKVVLRFSYVWCGKIRMNNELNKPSRKYPNRKY